MSRKNDLLNSFSQGYQEPWMNGQCNILIIGKSGVGKSTLINAIFGEPLAKTGAGKPVTKSLQHYTTQNCPVTIYDSPGLEISRDNLIVQIFFDHNKRVKKDVFQLIESNKKLAPKQHIHIIWYCINNAGDRLEQAEEDWIRELSSKGLPVIIVLTKAMQTPSEELLKCLRKLPVSERIIPVLAESMEISQHTVEAHGLENLVSKTAQLLPDVAKIAFINALKSIDIKAHEAVVWLIHAYIPSAFLGSLLLPIPFIGSKVSTAAVQITMLAHISNFFELPLDLPFISAMFCDVAGISLDFSIENILEADSIKEFLKLDSFEEVLKQGLNQLTQMIHSRIQNMPAEVPIVGGAVAGSSAAVSTLVIGLAYIDVLKRCKTELLVDGKEISVDELAKMLLERIQYYTQLGWNILKSLVGGSSGQLGLG